MRSSVIKIVNTLHKNKKMYILTGVIAALLVIFYALFAWYTVGKYELISEQIESLYAEKIIASSDRTLKSYIDRYQEELTYIIHRKDFQAQEAKILEEGTPDALLDYFKEQMVPGDLSYTDMVAIDNDTIVLSYDLSKGQILRKDIIQTINRGGCICAGKGGEAYLAFYERSENGVVYGLFINLAEFFETALGKTDETENYEISLYDAKNPYYVYQMKDVVHAEQEPSEKVFKEKGLSYIQEAYEENKVTTNFYQNRNYGSGKLYRARIHSMPAYQTDNQLLSIAVSINYDKISAPAYVVIRRMIYAAVFIVICLIVFVMSMFYIIYRHNESLMEINNLKVKNRELSLLHDQMNDNLHHQRLETIGTLTSGIAHEFNNLLSPIMGYSVMALDVAEGEGEKEDLEDYLVEIYNSTKNAKTLIRRISDLSRKNSDMTIMQVEFDPLIRKEMEAIIATKPSNMIVNVNYQAEDAMITANPMQVSQMVLNLVINSIQAIQEAGNKTGEITVVTSCDTERVSLKVQDNGPGISKENLEKIYEPFFTTKEAGKGTGLGLAIVQQVVEEHRGTIEVQSEVGTGTTFSITFPRN